MRGIKPGAIPAVLAIALLGPAAAQTGLGAAQQPHPARPAVSDRVLPQPAGDERAGPRLTLQDLEKMALEKNPVLAQAATDVRAAEGRRIQAGLYPNPAISAVGEEISTGPIIRGGELGVGFRQRFVTAGKLGKARRVAEQDVNTARAAADAERYRLLSAVRTLYYQALADQTLLAVRQQLVQVAREAVNTSLQLVNVGQADRPDLLAADVEAQRLELGLITARNARERTWRQLASVVNDTSLRPVPLAGDLEDIPKLEIEQALARIYSESPQLRAAQIATTRSELAIQSARAERIPDVVVSGGVRYNRELLEQGPGGLRPVGKEGFFDISVELPIFSRNQGNIAATKAQAERARLDVERTRLVLRARLASVYREYEDALQSVERYRKEMIPKARTAYQTYLNSFRQMAAAYPQVLIAQRNLCQLHEDYVAALLSAWQRSVEIQNLLLGGEEFLGAMPPAPERAAPTMWTAGKPQE